MMRDLAVFDGSAAAAMWLASLMADDGKLQEWPKEKLQEYVDWLALAADNAPQEPAPRLALSDILLSHGDLERAYSVLQPLTQSDSEVAFRVVNIVSLMGRTDLARDRAKPMIRALQSYLRDNPADLNARIRCASLLPLIGRADESVSLLRDGLLYAPTSEQQQLLNQTLTSATYNYVTILRTEPLSTQRVRNQLVMLESILRDEELKPQFTEALIETCLDSHQLNEPEIDELRESLIADLSPSTARFILGTVALRKGNPAEAKSLLLANIEEHGNDPGLLNNIAHAMMTEEAPDLPAALKLANLAVSQMPQHPYLRETRGQILYRLGRYREAIVDLEIANAMPELWSTVRPSLADAYDRLGMTDQATAIRSQSQSNNPPQG